MKKLITRAVLVGSFLTVACVRLPAGHQAPKADCVAAVDDQDRLCAARGPGCVLEPKLQCGQADAVVLCECRCPGTPQDSCPDGRR